MRKYIIVVRHHGYEENLATTNNYETAVEFALEALRDNKGKVVKIKTLSK